jgi:hypothetical protein
MPQQKTRSAQVEAGGRAIYEALRNGPRRYVDWDEIPEDHRDDLCAAFEKGLAAYLEAK